MPSESGNPNSLPGGVIITCLYSCEGCGIKDARVDVVARAADEDVVAWMDQAVRSLARDHSRRSPHCRPQSLQEIKIPITGADRIGGPALQ